jgi:hypothetical protein
MKFEVPSRQAFGRALRGLGSASLALLAAACGGGTDSEAKTGGVQGPVTDAQRLFPLDHNTVFSYETETTDSGKGVLVIEVSRPRATMAELRVAGRVSRLYVTAEGIQYPAGGFLLKSPVNDSGEWQGDFGTVSVTRVGQVVEVPAGKFTNCIETIEETDTPAFSKKTTSVYCPVIGMVTRLMEGEAGGVHINEKLTLKSFGPRFVAGMP